MAPRIFFLGTAVAVIAACLLCSSPAAVSAADSQVTDILESDDSDFHGAGNADIQPVPEPSTILLLVTAGLSLLFVPDWAKVGKMVRGFRRGPAVPLR